MRLSEDKPQPPATRNWDLHEDLERDQIEVVQWT